jgi:hypothetical protein
VVQLITTPINKRISDTVSFVDTGSDVLPDYTNCTCYPVRRRNLARTCSVVDSYDVPFLESSRDIGYDCFSREVADGQSGFVVLFRDSCGQVAVGPECFICNVCL